MAKKPLNVTLRKPSSAPPSDGGTSDKDAFVEGGRAGFRSLTVWLPNALADRLAAHCKSTGRDPSAVLSEIVQKHLDGLEARPTEVIEPASDPLRSIVRWVAATFGRFSAMRPAWLF